MGIVDEPLEGRQKLFGVMTVKKVHGKNKVVISAMARMMVVGTPRLFSGSNKSYDPITMRIIA